jgi:hypothetical protein
MIGVGNPGAYLIGVPLISLFQVFDAKLVMSAAIGQSRVFAFWYGFFSPRGGDFGDAAGR